MTKSRSEGERPLIDIRLWARAIKKEVMRDARASQSPGGYFAYYMALAERRERLLTAKALPRFREVTQ